MSTPTEQILAVLQSIDTTLKAMLSASRASQPKEMASDADLDGLYGDPEIKAKDPRDWTGPPMKGRFFSQCPPEYLDLLAARLDYFAEQAEENNELSTSGKPIAPYRRRDAARARGWARRLRNGWKPPEPSGADPFMAGGYLTTAQIPFAGKPTAVGELADDDQIAF